MAWYRRSWNVVRPGRLQRDLERELSFHVAERAEELLKAGMSTAEAARTARLQFGDFARHAEETRDADISGWLEAFVRNLRYAVRTHAKTPAFTVTVILTLALGIGANSAVFSAIDAVLLRPLPFPNGDELVELSQVHTRITQPFVAPVRLEEWNHLNGTFQAITGYYSEDVSELSGDFPEKLKRIWVAPRFLQVLGIAPALGRDFSPREERFGGPNAVLISHKLWQHRFNGNPKAIGMTLRIGAVSFPIIGIMPASFRFPGRDADLWSVSAPDAPYARSREATWFTAIGRLRPTVTLAQARANLVAVQSSLGRRYPKTDAVISPAVEPLKEVTVGRVRKSLWLLYGSVSLLLLIACINIAALLLSRGAGRRHEVSTRYALGASRAMIAAQLLTEILVLALAGAVLGLVVAAGASEGFRALARDLPRLEEIGLNWRIALYSFACAIAVTLVCGVFPVCRGTRRDLAAALARGGRSHVPGRNPVQFVLVGVQVALAVTLLAAAGLLVRSFQELTRVSPGFDPQHVLTFHISTTWGETNDQAAARQRANRVLEGLQSVPGVEAAATALTLPGVPSRYEVELNVKEGRAEAEPKILAQVRWVTPAYFAAMHIPLVAGELCRDDPKTTTMMVNRSFVSMYLNGLTPIGRHLVQPADAYVAPGEIRGIVGDARETGLDREPPPIAYYCAGSSQPGTFFLVRTYGEPNSMAGTIRQKVHELEPMRSIYDVTPLSDHISDAYADNRLRTILISFFAMTAISLACIGLYGTLSYIVNAHRREVALRLALGAMRTQVAQQFLVQGMRVCLLGCTAGLMLAAAFSRLISGMLYGVSASDPVIIGGIVVFVLAVSLLASLLPAIRAALLDPAQLLREE